MLKHNAQQTVNSFFFIVFHFNVIVTYFKLKRMDFNFIQIYDQ